MDLIYPIGYGSMWGNKELMYSLRSVEKHLKGFDRVFIVGRHPRWIKGIEYLDIKDDKENKEKNITFKVRAVCDTDISEDFVFMNDDHIFTQDTSVNIPNYWSLTCQQMILRRVAGRPYQNAIQGVIDLYGYDAKYFDIHVPMVFNKTKFKTLIDQTDFSHPDGIILKSLYGNHYKLDGPTLLDFKPPQPQNHQFWIEKAKERFCLSFGDASLNVHLKKYLEKTYPKKSRFEK